MGECSARAAEERRRRLLGRKAGGVAGMRLGDDGTATVVKIEKVYSSPVPADRRLLRR